MCPRACVVGPRPRGPRPFPRAFTLVEMLMVVAVAGILAALVVPFASATWSSRLRSAANLLAADLAFAQVQSITHTDNLCSLVLDQPNQRYYLAAASAPATPITNPESQLPYSVTFGQGRAGGLAGVTIQSYSLGGTSSLPYGMYGQLPTASPATITLGAQGHTITLTIDPTSGEASIGPVN